MKRVISRFSTARLIAVLMGILVLATGAVVQAHGTTTTAVPYQDAGYRYQAVSHGNRAGFEAVSFDDSSWDVGAAGFGTTNSVCSWNNSTHVQTEWVGNGDLLVRKWFSLPPGAHNLRVVGTIDNNATVYINGVEIGYARSGWCIPEAIDFLAPDDILASGDNLLAIRGVDTGGVAFLDVQVTYDALNEAPMADAGGPYTTAEGNPLSLDGTASSDPGGDALNYAWDPAYDGTTFAPDPALAGSTPSVTYPDNGTFTVALQVTNDEGIASEIATATVTIENVPPAVEAGSDAAINEGDTFVGAGAFTDPGMLDSPWTAPVDYGDGSGSQPLALNADQTFNLTHLYRDNGAYPVTVAVTDKDGGLGTDTLTVTVNNLSPTVGPITGLPTHPIGIHVTVEAIAEFTDLGLLDTHTAVWDWGDGTTSVGAVAESDGAGTVTGSHQYPAAGSYTVTLTVTDKDGGSGQSVFQFVDVKGPPVDVPPDHVPPDPDPPHGS